MIMINPFGQDKDDFEVKFYFLFYFFQIQWLTDRHWQVIYRTLDEPWKFFPQKILTEKVHVARNRKRKIPKQLGHTFASAWNNMSRYYKY